MYYKVLAQYYSVLQSTTPVLLCTTQCYSSTTLYYKALLRYYSVLQSTTPVLICTTKYLHTWHVIYNARSNKSQLPTSATTAPATQNDSRDQSATHLKRYLQCAEQQVASSNITKYCACHAKWLSWLILVTYETLWNAIYNARNHRWHPPTSPNTAPATQNDSPKFQRNFSKTAETSFPMRGRSELDPSWIRARSELDPRMKPSLRNPPRNRGYFSRPPQAFCIEKYNISRSGYHSKFHQILRPPRKVTLQLHQILRLPRKVTLERHQIMHLPRKVTLERHQIVHLPRKVTLERHQIVTRI